MWIPDVDPHEPGGRSPAILATPDTYFISVPEYPRISHWRSFIHAATIWRYVLHAFF
jgi:hypothetical protein